MKWCKLMFMWQWMKPWNTVICSLQVPTRAQFTTKEYYMLAASSHERTVCSDDYVQCKLRFMWLWMKPRKAVICLLQVPREQSLPWKTIICLLQVPMRAQFAVTIIYSFSALARILNLPIWYEDSTPQSLFSVRTNLVPPNYVVAYFPEQIYNKVFYSSYLGATHRHLKKLCKT